MQRLNQALENIFLRRPQSLEISITTCFIENVHKRDNDGFDLTW